MNENFDLSVDSEIGELEGVVIHTPGSEVENMIPQNVARALYSDILNLSVVSDEYNRFKTILNKFTNTFEVQELLSKALENDNAKSYLLNKVCQNEGVECISSELSSLTPEVLAKQLIEGVPLKVDNLTKFLSSERYSLQPLHNFFFTRDASITINNEVLIAKLKGKVREREALIMETIFKYFPKFKTQTISSVNDPDLTPEITMEGGDILVVNEETLLIGNGARTSTQGIDYILNKLKRKEKLKHLIVQELPHSPESFIHLDMVFTFLDYDSCMIYEPAILNQHDFQTVHITLENGEVKSIDEETNILTALKKLNIDLKPISCGGTTDNWAKEREQWHSGANFFAVAPGKILGYGRNVHTLEELDKNGFHIISAKDFIKKDYNKNTFEKVAICIHGSELSRGGGGCRCMTMPIKRKPVTWK